MRCALVLAVVACGHPAPPAVVSASHGAPRLLPPLPADPAAKGAAYLSEVALRFQPGWTQFLDDCRLRLPGDHPLNAMALSATAELAVDQRGRIVDVALHGSGNADYDRAIHDALADAQPLPAPPLNLLSDDDRIHLTWLFARDRRQAGPATAAVVMVDLPVAAVVTRLVGEGDLVRAARRVQRVTNGAERFAAITAVMVAALREALGSADAASRRAAVDAIGRARVRELAPDVRALLGSTTDAELRLVAIDAAAALEDDGAVPALLAGLPVDLPDHPRLALAETLALVRLGHSDDAATAVLKDIHMMMMMSTRPHPIALQALALAPVSTIDPELKLWMRSGDAPTRAGVCTAAGARGANLALLAKGLGDPDASVRVACIDAARARAGEPTIATVAPRIRELVRDRDRQVRAHALAAAVELRVLDDAHLASAADDPASEVRAAFATALATALPSQAVGDLRVLVDDRNPDVRAAAWGALVALAAAPPDRAELALRAVHDAAPQVRLAAIPALDDDAALARLATSDDAPDVRTAATVDLAGRRGRAASEPALLDRLAAAPPASAERVRVALAWLLAP
jgi:hypothetical protein